jgi:hypothetical protein
MTDIEQGVVPEALSIEIPGPSDMVRRDMDITVQGVRMRVIDAAWRPHVHADRYGDVWTGMWTLRLERRP